jgi:hypothetical protein
MTDKPVQTSLAVHETDNTITLGSNSWDSNFRDRLNYDRQNILTQAITAWRSNPIARRIIEIETEFVMGDGFAFTSPGNSEKFLREFWNHPLNNLDQQLPEWADEAWRTGDLFLLVSVDPGGMCYVRALPSESIGVIVTRDNDYRQELAYQRDATDENPWPAFDPSLDQANFVIHFPLSRAIGASFGESDLAPVLYWIGLYRQWLEDRARLNYFRQMFSFVLTRPFTSQAEKEKYMRDFAARLPKMSGGVLGLDPNETLSALNPNLASSDAELDGLALKRMIAAGVGMPLHYLAEPESSTRTTAEAAGAPTFKRLKRRQQYMVNVVKSLLLTVYSIHRKVITNLPVNPHIDITTSDITERDNANLAIAVQRIVTAFAPIYNAKLITPQEFIRLVYRFVAETMPESGRRQADPDHPFIPVNLRGGGGSSRLPNTDPGEPQKDDPHSIN